VRQPQARPLARQTDLVIKQVTNEVLVYDLERHRAHSLNALAAAVWRACDGTREVQAISAAVSTEIGQPVPVTAVHYALHVLGRAQLLTSPVDAIGLTRRDLIRRLGTAAAVMLPLVTTVTAPTAAQAQSCLSPGDSCTSDPQCCGGTCNTGCACLAGVCTLI